MKFALQCQGSNTVGVGCEDGEAASLLLSSDRRILAVFVCVKIEIYYMDKSTGPRKYYTPRSCLAMETDAMTLPAHSLVLMLMIEVWNSSIMEGLQ